MDENPIFSERASHYNKFKFVSLLLKNEQPLTLDLPRPFFPILTGKVSMRGGGGKVN